MDAILQVAIGLFLTFAVMAVVVSSVMELISATIRMRARTLEHGIARLLDNQRKTPKDGWRGWLGVRESTEASSTAAVKDHPLIRALSAGRATDRLPSYIDAVTFATAFLGSSIEGVSLIAKFVEGRDELDKRIKKLSDAQLGPTVKAAWKEAGGEPAKLITLLLANKAHGYAGLAALITDVDDRLAELKAAGDPASPTLEAKWSQANSDPATFITSLEQPDLLTRAVAGAAEVTAGIQQIKLTNEHLGKSLEALWIRANSDFGKFRGEIEDWFDREMARVSGWYSRWAQWIMVAIALLLVSALNISAVTIGKALWLDPTIRDKAESIAAQPTTTVPTTITAPPTATTSPPTTAAPQTTATTVPQLGVDTLNEVGLPVGWNSTAWPGWDLYLVLHIFGMVLVLQG